MIENEENCYGGSSPILGHSINTNLENLNQISSNYYENDLINNVDVTKNIDEDRNNNSLQNSLRIVQNHQHEGKKISTLSASHRQTVSSFISHQQPSFNHQQSTSSSPSLSMISSSSSTSSSPYNQPNNNLVLVVSSGPIESNLKTVPQQQFPQLSNQTEDELFDFVNWF